MTTQELADLTGGGTFPRIIEAVEAMDRFYSAMTMAQHS
jgi:hypothetical protein